MKTGTLIDILFVFAMSFTAYRLPLIVSGLKVHVEYLDDRFTLRTQHIVRLAVRYVSRLLSVRNESRNPVFRIPRDKYACMFAYFDGPNAGKCGQISRRYTGVDQCNGARIPPAHLEGLQVFGHEELEPLPSSLPQGDGFTDGTNFVVYLTLRESKLCTSSLAYSQVCRTEATGIGGVHSGRPVAGTINACWKEGEIDDIVIRRIVIHELIHLLAMNYKSIREFVECEGKNNTRMCWKLRNVIRVTQDGKVVVWSRHFRKIIRRQKICEDGSQCQLSSDSPGCPHQACITYDGMVLGNVTRSVNTFGGVVLAKSLTGVHWPDELFDDPTSVMVPAYVQSGRVMVDPLTVTLFRTSGWYWVNHTVLFCINHFLNTDALSPNCSNLVENKNDFIYQNETYTGGMTTAQDTSSLGSPMNISKDHEPAIATENVAEDETHHSTLGLNKFTWVKQQRKGPSGDTESGDVKSDASQCSPTCAVTITIQIVFVYTAVKVIL